MPTAALNGQFTTKQLQKQSRKAAKGALDRSTRLTAADEAAEKVKLKKASSWR